MKTLVICGPTFGNTCVFWHRLLSDLSGAGDRRDWKYLTHPSFRDDKFTSTTQYLSYNIQFKVDSIEVIHNPATSILDGFWHAVLRQTRFSLYTWCIHDDRLIGLEQFMDHYREVRDSLVCRRWAACLFIDDDAHPDRSAEWKKLAETMIADGAIDVIFPQVRRPNKDSVDVTVADEGRHQIIELICTLARTSLKSHDSLNTGNTQPQCRGDSVRVLTKSDSSATPGPKLAAENPHFHRVAQMNQSRLLNELPQRYNDIIAKTCTLTGSLSESQLTWSPGEKAWSPAEILHHVSRTVETYLDKMIPALEKAPTASAPETVSLKGGIAGALILKTLSSPKQRNMPAPKAFHPERNTADAFDRFETAHRRLTTAIEKYSDRNWAKAIFGTPVSPLLRASAIQAFLIHAVHAERHIAQLERLTKHPAFPGA